MKTYTRQIIETKPRLVIYYDTSAESPRNWDNLGHFFTKERNCKSPDSENHPLYQIMIETSEIAKNTDNHMKLMLLKAKELYRETKNPDHKILHIFPVNKYEHSGIVYRMGTAMGWDYSNCGFYIITAKNKQVKNLTQKEIEKNIDIELTDYTSWMNGEVKGFTLYDEKGETIDACGGFYSLEEIAENLSPEWKNEDLRQYINSNL